MRVSIPSWYIHFEYWQPTTVMWYIGSCDIVIYDTHSTISMWCRGSCDIVIYDTYCTMNIEEKKMLSRVYSWVDLFVFVVAASSNCTAVTRLFHKMMASSQRTSASTATGTSAHVGIDYVVTPLDLESSLFSWFLNVDGLVLTVS